MMNLAIENETLREQIAQLKALHLGASIAVPIDWPLTKSESIMLRVLIQREVASREALYLALYSERRGDWPLDNTLCTLISKLKKKLAPRGIRVKCTRRVGYWLEPSMRKSLKEQFSA